MSSVTDTMSREPDQCVALTAWPGIGQSRRVTARLLSFQQMILKLHHYWSERGCVILQPYDMEMGAGTFHPATTLRALGPDPWNAAFVQPCRRPTDGRYGENPNRLGAYYQFQVILKPIASRSAGHVSRQPRRDRRRHRAARHPLRRGRLGKSPTLGAWGLGWEVWCDGMEVTQFTYFQQMGGFDCKPVAGELTYGLERLAMYIQDVDNVYDLAFNDAGVSYGDVFLENERQASAYNFEVADTDALFDAVPQSDRRVPELPRPSTAHSRRMNRRSGPATLSTCCRPAASFRSPSARPISAASATSRRAPARRG